MTLCTVRSEIDTPEPETTRPRLQSSNNELQYPFRSASHYVIKTTANLLDLSLLLKFYIFKIIMKISLKLACNLEQFINKISELKFHFQKVP